MRRDGQLAEARKEIESRSSDGDKGK